jgi:hypothetical protein
VVNEAKQAVMALSGCESVSRRRRGLTLGEAVTKQQEQRQGFVDKVKTAKEEVEVKVMLARASATLTTR